MASGKSPKLLFKRAPGETLRKAQSPITPEKLAGYMKIAETGSAEEKEDLGAVLGMPSEVLDKLANDPDLRVRGAAASNRNLSPESQRKLSKDTNMYVLGGLAENRALDPIAADQLALVADQPTSTVGLTADTGLKLATCLIRNPQTPLSAQKILAKHPDERVRESLTGISFLHPELASVLAEDKSMAIKQKLAGRSSIGLEAALKLSKDRERGVRVGLAYNHLVLSKFPAILNSLAKDSDYKIRIAVVGANELSPEMQMAVADDPNSQVRAMLADSDSPLTPEVQRKLAEDTSADVGRGLAGYRGGSLLEDVALKLANHPNPSTQYYLAHRQDLSDAVKTQLATSGAVNTVFKLLQTQNDLPIQAMEFLAQHENPDVREALVAHGDLPLEIAKRLAVDPYLAVRQKLANEGLADRKNQPELVDILSQDEHASVRTILAQHSDLSPEVVRRLALDGDLRVQTAIASNQTLPPDLVEKYALSPDLLIRQEVARRQPLTPAAIDHLAAHKDVQLDRFLVDRTDINLHPQQIESYFISNPDAVVRSSLAKRSDLSPQHIEKLANDLSGAVRGEIARRKDLSPELIETLSHDAHRNIREMIAAHPNVTPGILKRFLTDSDVQVRDFAQRVLGRHDPDSLHDDSVGVRFDTNKLRKLRDQILATGKDEVHPKLLAPGDWSAGRLPNGNVSAQKLQQHIDSLPETKYNVSEGVWTGGQRHSQDDSKVFQLNLTTDMINRMKGAGVADTFRNVYEASHYSAHPVTPTTLGWVRWTGDPSTQKGVFIDEIQSDFGHSLVKQAAAQAKAHAEKEAEGLGLTGEAKDNHVKSFINKTTDEAQKKWADTDHQKILDICFNGKKPNEVLYEGFVQHLRNKGFHDHPIHMHTVKTKMPLSQQDPSKEAPAHMQFTYGQMPKRMGLEPAGLYGDLPTESGFGHGLKGKVVWAGRVRKSEKAPHLRFGFEALRKASPTLQSFKDRRFNEWFGDSSVVEGGSTSTKDPYVAPHPMVLYHGSKDKFDTFKHKEGINSCVLGDWPVQRHGFFFTPDKDAASEYAGPNGHVHQVHLAINNPLDLRNGISEKHWNELEGIGFNPRWLNNLEHHWEAFDDENGKHYVNTLRRLGYDGAIFREASPDREKTVDTLVAFHPGQIKSVDNRGTWNPELESIHKAEEQLATPGQIAEWNRVLEDGSPYEVTEMAKDPQLPPEMMEKLATHEYADVRQALAYNKNLPQALIEKSASDGDSLIRYAVACHKKLSTHLIERLAEDPDPGIRQRIAKRQDLPKAAINSLVGDGSRFVRIQLAQNPQLDLETVNRLVADENVGVRETILNHPNLDLQGMNRLAADENPVIRGMVARRVDLSIPLLDKLSQDSNWEIRHNVAANPNIPSQAMERLAGDIRSVVRYQLVQNPSLSSAVVNRMIQDRDHEVRRFLATHPLLTPASMERLAQDGERDVGIALAQHPQLAPAAVDLLAQNKDWVVRSTLSEHSHLTPAAMDRLSQDKEIAVRRSLAENSHLTPATIDRLVNDKHPWVRGGLLSRRDLTSKHIEALMAHPNEDPNFWKQIIKNPNSTDEQKMTAGFMRDAAFSVVERLSGVGDFWRDYEDKVRADHFATVKALFSGQSVDNYEGFRGDRGRSRDKIIPNMREYAEIAQRVVQDDPDIVFRRRKGRLYIKAYRGVTGDYAAEIAKQLQHDPQTNTVVSRVLKVEMAPFASWSTRRGTAESFATTRNIHGQPHYPLLIEKWKPLDSLLHSGYHDLYGGHEHEHPGENELIFGYPEETMHITPQNVHFLNGPTESPNGFGPGYASEAKPLAFEKPKIKHPEEPKLKKSIDVEGLEPARRRNRPIAQEYFDADKQFELIPETVKPHADKYNAEIRDSATLFTPGQIPGIEGVSPKVIVKAPGQNYMLKHYNEGLNPNLSVAFPGFGWTELTNQALFHAAGIGHLHQRVHAAHHNVGEGKSEPFAVIHMAPGHEAMATVRDPKPIREKYGKDIQKILLMDFIADNGDRHHFNMMHDLNTLQPLAIDHGFALQYRVKKNPGVFFGHWDKFTPRDWNDAFKWWGAVGGRVREELDRQLETVRNPKIKQHIKENFEKRAEWADRKAKEGVPPDVNREPGEWVPWQSEEIQPIIHWPFEESK